MKKSEIETNYHPGSRGEPMVNVKVYRSVTDADIASVLAEDGQSADAPTYGLTFDLEYVERLLEQDEWIWQAACESGWEMLQSDAEELFGSHVKVYSEGRQGGWAVVHGLDDVESWDAIACNRWGKFARWARAQADDIPRAMVWLAYHNIYLPALEELAAAAAWEAEDMTWGDPLFVAV